jgi:hypothetical protein
VGPQVLELPGSPTSVIRDGSNADLVEAALVAVAALNKHDTACLHMAGSKWLRLTAHLEICRAVGSSVSFSYEIPIPPLGLASQEDSLATEKAY